MILKINNKNKNKNKNKKNSSLEIELQLVADLFDESIISDIIVAA